MRRTSFLILLFGCFLLIGFNAKADLETINGVKITRDDNSVSIENKWVALNYNLKLGTYTAKDKLKNLEVIYNASTNINSFSSKDLDAVRSFKTETIFDILGKGASILISSKKAGFPTQLLRIKLYESLSTVVFEAGIKNTTDKDFIVKKIVPVADASLFKNQQLNNKFRLLNGEGGGIETFIQKEPAVLSQNNVVLNFGGGSNPHTLVAGGLTYNEFEKSVQITEDNLRAPDLANLLPNASMLEYVDIGEISDPSIPKYVTIDKFNNKTKFKFAGSFAEAKSIIYDSGEFKIDFKNLKFDEDYILGLVFGSNYDSQKQSVLLLQNGEETELLAPTLLPDLSTGKSPKLYLFPISAKLRENGLATIIIRKNTGSNTILNELVFYKGSITDVNSPIEIPKSPSKFINVKFNLFAEDPIGKRVSPGETYLPAKDAFYLNFSESNPINAAEDYALTVKKAQQVSLKHYFFPTICLWYAMQPLYGGGVAGSVRAINDSPGAVAEMQMVKNSGWLKYTTMGIRLVPDSYGKNNENGWWDDEHWQKYGSGDAERQGTTEMELPGAHYRKPYETTKKWASAVRELGGLPFFYMQSGVRSNDYCEAFPNQMLHNTAYHKIGGKPETLNFNYGSYDFTDTAFVKHMTKVYADLRDAKISGMMFDFPQTVWAPYGGMDDKFATTGSHYRKVFELASKGLGAKAYNQERNITRGSDLTAGIVESQRIWGDIDVITAEMVMRGGLRWYKNRVLYNYDMDAKSLTKAMPSDNNDGINKLLTMSYVTASRLILGESFAKLDTNKIHSLSRVFPYHDKPKSARPIDAFSSDYPRIYDFEVDSTWHQLTYYNEDNEYPKTISSSLNGVPGYGGLGLNENKNYYVYDFWNNNLVGIFAGSDSLKLTLRKGEARMMSVREQTKNPQVLSTDRHLMQGFIELSNVQYTNRLLSGDAQLVENETMKIIIAINGKKPKSVLIEKGKASFKMIDKNLMELSLATEKSEKLKWNVKF